MTPFTTVEGPAVPLLKDNVDTDVIIRIDRLTRLPRDQLGPFALEALRRRPDGAPDPECPIDRPEFRGAPILLAGSNFGCGSSREAAVWALMGLGMRCVIAPSFGDIFFNNCFQNGMLPVRLPAAAIERLSRLCAGGAPLRVDLGTCEVRGPDGSAVPFDVDPLRRDGLLQGLDDIGLTLQQDTEIRAWQQADRHRRPWAWPAGA